MQEPSISAADPRQCLSELADGEVDAQALEQGCALWAADAEARRTWHAYHLIGDVLRSEDLACTAQRDAAFLDGVRRRLADEPVVLAPGRPSPVRARRHAWAAPMAVAAGFVAVAGVLVVLRLGSPAPEATAPALAAAPAAVPLRVVNAPDGQMLRDARVDEYLRAHRATLAGSPAALPGGAMRSVEMIVPSR